MMFCVAEESLANHVGERKVRLEEEDVAQLIAKREEQKKFELEKKAMWDKKREDDG